MKLNDTQAVKDNENDNSEHIDDALPDGELYVDERGRDAVIPRIDESGTKRYRVHGGRAETYDFRGELAIEDVRNLAEVLNRRNEASIDLTLPHDALAYDVIHALYSWGEEADECGGLRVLRDVVMA